MSVATAITVELGSSLRDYCGLSELELQAATVREALSEIERRYPSLYRSVCNDAGALRQHVGVFVNEDHIRDLDGVDTPLSPGDALIFLPAVSGG